MMLFPNQHLLYHHQQKSHISQVKPQFKKVDQSSFGKFKCSYCTSQFSSAPSLKSHISRVHMCSTNNQQSTISTMMGVASMNRFLGDSKLFHCEFCSVPFSTVRSLNMHKTKSHGPNMTSQEFSKPLVVDIAKIKSEQLDLDTYIKKQYSMETTKNKCSFCCVRFTTKQTMKAHYQRAHFTIFIGIHIYSCSKCDFATGNETSFLHHKAALLDCTSGMTCIKCEKCDQMFTTMKKMLPHVRENHGEKIQFKLDLPIPPCLLENNPTLPEFKLDLPIPPCLLVPKQEILENSELPENKPLEDVEEKETPISRKSKKRKKKMP